MSPTNEYQLDEVIFVWDYFHNEYFDWDRKLQLKLDFFLTFEFNFYSFIFIINFMFFF